MHTIKCGGETFCLRCSKVNEKERTSIEYLVKLAAAGARGKSVQVHVPNWMEILQLGAEHNVIPLIACAVKDSPTIECPDQIKEYLLNAMRSSASLNMIRRQRIMHLIRELKAAEIPVKLLKGYAISDCYAYPDCRDSVDTDFLISIKQENMACALFEEHGFRIKPREATSQHVICQHSKYGMVELHVKLYADLIEDVWFQGMKEDELLKENEIERSSCDGEYNTLGNTDHLIFLVLHMMKHFISGGLTIKMMLDIALHFQQNKDTIDAERFWQIMKRLSYSTFVSSMLQVMIAQEDFEPADFPGLESVPPENVQLLLNDLVEGGYMGAKQKKERHESGMAYNRQMLLKKKSQVQYSLYMLWWKARTGAKYMFPSIKLLQSEHRITKTHPATIPFVWVYHVIAFPIKKVQKGVLQRDILTASEGRTDIAQQRMKMFHSLGML